MVVCEQCGSLQIARVHATPSDKLLGLFTGKRPLVCRRCGWRASRAWTDAELKKSHDYSRVGGAEVDPDLADLDAPTGDRSHKSQDRRERRSSRTETKTAPEFDLGALGLPAGKPEEPSFEELLPTSVPVLAGRVRPRIRAERRSKRARRREILRAIGVSALALFVVGMLGLTGSCGGAPIV